MARSSLIFSLWLHLIQCKTVEHGWIFQLIQWKNTSIRNSRISNLVNFVSLTSGQLDDPGDDDDEEGEELGVGEDVLHSGCPLDLVEV